MSEWQPIKTAPKDGSEILVWCSDSNEMFVVVWNSGWQYAEDSDVRFVLEDDVGEVHWMRPPAPPIDTAR